MLTVYQDLAIPTRRAMLATLLTGPKNVSEVVAETGFKQPNVSNHFAKMRQSRSVKSSRIGREIFYTFASPSVEEAVRSAIQAATSPRGHLNLSDCAEDFAKNATLGREAECTDTIDRVLRVGTGLIDIYEDLIARSMAIVGRMYERGEIDEGHEHAASAITERMLARISAAQLPHRSTGQVALIGCAANNWHTIGARLVADFLKHQGWRVIYLGPNVPTEAFLNAVAMHGPSAVLVSTSSESVLDARSLLIEMRSRFPSLPIAIGGTGANEEPSRFQDVDVAYPGPALRSVVAWLAEAGLSVA